MASHTTGLFSSSSPLNGRQANFKTLYKLPVSASGDTRTLCHALLLHMAYTTSPQASFLTLGRKVVKDGQRRRRSCASFQVFAANQSAESSQPQNAPPGTDTRIHWDNQDEGWIGGNSNTQSSDTFKVNEEQQQQDFLGDKFSDLINSTNSHYQFLGVQVGADLEEIRTAYRRLSKEYHPDTTTLPLKTASEKFMKLREVYNILSNEETRRFYDWTLAQEAASLRAEKMKVKFEDPYDQEVANWESIPDTVDRLKGRNLKLSDQAMTALTVDAVILVFSICCIVYVIFFKEPY